MIQVRELLSPQFRASFLVTPKSSSSSDGSAFSGINFNPQVHQNSSNEQYASIKRSVSRQRPTSFNTMRPISITGVPEKQESPSYMSQTLPLRGSIRNKNYNAIPAPPVPISQRNRTEVVIYYRAPLNINFSR